MFWSKTKIWNLLKNMSRITDGIWAVSHLTCLPVFHNLLRLFWDWITQCFSLSSPIFFFFLTISPSSYVTEWLESSLLALSPVPLLWFLLNLSTPNFTIPYRQLWSRSQVTTLCPSALSHLICQHSAGCDLLSLRRELLLASWAPLTLSRLSLSPAAPLRPSLSIPSHFLTLKHWPQHPDHFCFQHVVPSVVWWSLLVPIVTCLIVLVSSGCHDKIP